MQMYRLVSAGLSVSLALACVVILEAQRGSTATARNAAAPTVPAFRLPGCRSRRQPQGRLGNTGARGLVSESRWHYNHPGRLYEPQSKLRYLMFPSGRTTVSSLAGPISVNRRTSSSGETTVCFR